MFDRPDLLQRRRNLEEISKDRNVCTQSISMKITVYFSFDDNDIMHSATVHAPKNW